MQSFARHARWGLVGAIALATLAGCGPRERTPQGELTQGAADRYVHEAVRRSNEGLVLMPSKKAERAWDQTLLNDLAQSMRGPAAICFLERAIVTMEATGDEESPWKGVPDGQAKFRARIGPDGQVMRAEVLDSGFKDEDMEGCLSKMIEEQQFPASRQGFTHYVDVIYWVSLGFHAEVRSAEYRRLVRKQQAMAAVRAKACFRGRVQPGTYPITGLNLTDREGRTVVNRVERGDLPQEVSSCIAAAFRAVRIQPEREAFIRPVTPAASFEVSADGLVSTPDERWLELVLLEERAERDQRRRELGVAGEPVEAEPDRLVPAIPLANPGLGSRDDEPGTEPELEPEPNIETLEAGDEPPPAEELPDEGVRLDLNPRG